MDWVIIALKTTSFPAIPSLLSDRRVVGKETRVLALMNGYGLERDLEEKAGVDGGRIFGGMAFVCANRGPIGSGEVAHLKYGKLVIGHFKVSPTAPCLSHTELVSFIAFFPLFLGLNRNASSPALPFSPVGRPCRALVRLPSLPGHENRGANSSSPSPLPFSLLPFLAPALFLQGDVAFILILRFR